MNMNSPKGRVHIDLVESRILKDNPLGDPAARQLVVYTPPGYEATEERYPVIYLLSSFMGFGRMFLSPQAWGYAMDERCDELMGGGAMKKCLVVMPDCFTKWGGSQYVNSTATGRYEDHLIEEIVPFVDRQYRTLPAARHRAVGGKSSGGFGALHLSLRHPDVFGACYCGAGDMYFEYGYLGDIPKCFNMLRRTGGLDGFLSSFFESPKKSSDQLAAINVIAMSAAYSPNPKSPHGLDLPFDMETGELRNEVWSRWLSFDPVRRVADPASVAALKSLRLLYLDCGTRDEYHLHIGARILSARLKKLGVDHVHEEFDDGHMGTSYRYHHVLPRIAGAIAP